MVEWDRQDGEPERWFSRFERFRKAGSRRTLLGTFRAEQEERRPKKINPNLPGAWEEASIRWRWRARAEAWDAEQHRLNRIAEEKVLAERRAAWAMQAQGMQALGSQTLVWLQKAQDKLKEGDLSPDEISRLLAAMTKVMTAGIKEERLCRGEVTEITKTEHAGSVEITSEEARRTRLANIFGRFGDAMPGGPEADGVHRQPARVAPGSDHPDGNGEIDPAG